MYEQRIEASDKNADFWRSKYFEAMGKCGRYQEAVGKIKTYESILKKFLSEKCTTTDSMFMFEGECYQPTSFTLNREETKPDTLSVEFVKYPFDFMKKKEE